MKAILPLSQTRLCELSRELLRELGSSAQEVYAERLVSAAAYGSVGRGDLHENSDVDVLLVVQGLPPGRWSRYAQWDAIESKLESRCAHLRDVGWNWSLSPVIKTPEEVQIGSPLFLDMTEDAVLLVDRGHFLERYLAALKERLNDQGARRIWQGRTWYWDLQPNFQPGKKVEL